MSDIDKVFKASVKKQFEGIEIFNAKEMPKVRSNSTGSLKLDIMLHNPIYNGSLIEIYGNSGSGKTTLSLSILNQAILKNPNRKIFYFDQERRLQLSLIQTFPLLVDKLEIIRAPDGLQALNLLELYLRQYPEAIAVVDSVDSLLPEGDKNIGDERVGGLPMLMSKACRKLIVAASITGGVVIFLNQLRSKIGTYGNPETGSGGNALKFYANQRINLKDTTKDCQIKDDNGNVIGQIVRFFIQKNSVAPSYSSGEFPILYGKGVDIVDEVVDLACDLALLQKEGGYILIDGKKRPPKTVKDMVRSDPVLLESLSKQIRDLYPETFLNG